MTTTFNLLGRKIRVFLNHNFEPAGTLLGTGDLWRIESEEGNTWLVKEAAIQAVFLDKAETEKAIQHVEDRIDSTGGIDYEVEGAHV